MAKPFKLLLTLPVVLPLVVRARSVVGRTPFSASLALRLPTRKSDLRGPNPLNDFLGLFCGSLTDAAVLVMSRDSLGREKTDRIGGPCPCVEE